jgi:levansucrase
LLCYLKTIAKDDPTFLFDREYMLRVKPQTSAIAEPASSLWTGEHIALLQSAMLPQAPLIGAPEAAPVVPGLTLWDVWPVQLDNGDVAVVQDGSLWVVLSAPRRDDPNVRHNEARMRLLLRTKDNWQDCGNLLPDGFAPGSREWSGSTRLDPATGTFTLWFTAAGQRGTPPNDFEQRLFHATGTLDLSGEQPCVINWRGLTQSVLNDGSLYVDLAKNQGIPGRIKGFRDPYWFRDPATGQGYILFTASKPEHLSRSDYDGVIGIAAEQADGSYTLLPCLIDADGLANELERPHIFVRDGLYYLFWSSQIHVFAPDGPMGPTGLYGMVAPSLFGPYTPLNDSGLVLANPISEPRQAYAWQVLPTLEVVSFVDLWGLQGRDVEAHPTLKATHFGGTIAPMIKININQNATQMAADKA